MDNPVRKLLRVCEFAESGIEGFQEFSHNRCVSLRGKCVSLREKSSQVVDIVKLSDPLIFN